MTRRTVHTLGGMYTLVILRMSFLWSYLWIGYSRGELFSSTANLQHLADNERWVMEQLEMYVTRKEEHQHTFERAVENLRRTLSDQALDSARHFQAGHPIDAFALIQRWTEIGALLQLQKSYKYSALKETLIVEGISLPTEEDLVGATQALLRLQRTYDLPSAALAKGVVGGVPSERSLDAQDMLHLGKVALDADEFKLSLDWLTMAQESADSNFTKSEALWELTLLYQKVGEYDTALGVAEIALNTVAENSAAISRLLEMTRSLVNDVQACECRTDNHINWRKGKVKFAHEALCGGETFDYKRKPTLFCYYKPGILRYVRYKEEYFSIDPRISVFHEVISDAEAVKIQELAFAELERAMVGHDMDEATSGGRVGQVSWLWDEESDSLVRKLSNRVQDITGLSTQYRPIRTSAEPFQVVNYGIGGQYEPHYDFEENKGQQFEHPYIANTGDRLATFMFYLSDVIAGGATVFPLTGVRVPPVKNSAAFWFNLRPDGSPDRRTFHAGCPVLLGQKWVANKWVREWGQELRRPCGARQADLDDSKGVLHKCAKC